MSPMSSHCSGKLWGDKTPRPTAKDIEADAENDWRVLIDKNKALLCDKKFSDDCLRLEEGDGEKMMHSLQKVSSVLT
jgi:hypothetical protein